MALTYKHETVKREVVERELTVPNEWGMFTPKGNKSIKTKAEKLIADVEKASGCGEKTAAFFKFFRNYAQMSNSKSFSEASDTDVREQVWCFALRVARCVGMSEDTLDEIWEARYS